MVHWSPLGYDGRGAGVTATGGGMLEDTMGKWVYIFVLDGLATRLCSVFAKTMDRVVSLRKPWASRTSRTTINE